MRGVRRGLVVTAIAAGCSSRILGTDAAAPPGPDEVCRAVITTQCARRAACGDRALDECMAFTQLCPDYYINAASNRTVDGLQACLTELGNLSCTDLSLWLLPACLAPGTRAGGEACSYVSQCQSGWCSGTLACGTCAPAAGIDEPCDDVVRCPPGSFCHRATQRCAAGSTIVHHALGETCDLSASPVVGCAGDLLCVPAVAGSSAGTCTAAPALGPCTTVDNVEICASGLTCNVDGTCRPPDACGDTTCDATSACSIVSGAPACVKRPVWGEPCSTSGIPCLAPTTCVVSASGSGFVCADMGKLGDACDDARTEYCEFPLICVGGTCAALGAATCPAR